MRKVLYFALAALPWISAVQAQTWVSTATKALNLANATQLGALDSSTPLHLVVALQLRNADQIQPTLQRMITPSDPLYGNPYTVSQFVAQFAPTASQVQAVESYLSSYGFQNLAVSDNQLVVEADATAGQVTAAFNTALATFSLNGKTVFANTMDAKVPTSLATTVGAVLGLNNVAAVKIPQPPSATNILNGYSPQDFQIAYDAAYPADAPGGNANKQKVTPNCGGARYCNPNNCAPAIGIIAEGNLGTVSPNNPTSGNPSSSSTGVIHDLYLYEQNFHLPIVPVTIVNAGIPSPDTAGVDEWDLDSQTSTGLGLYVSRLYFYVATSLTDSDIGLAINKAVSQNQVKAFNMSFGECEFFPYVDGAMLLDDELFAEAALQGQTAFASTGDNGAACPVLPTNGVPLSGPPAVAYPASSPYVISSGGTDLFTNSDYTYGYEVSWNAGGGGISVVETAPFWESYTGGGTAPIVPSAAAGQRGLPDVAMCADPNTCGALIYVGGTQEAVGGTSLSSPLSMGSWARIEGAHGNKLGFAGPLIYQLGIGAPTFSTGPFNDVILGTNGVYTALPGWDYTTGLGSWDIFQVNKVIPATYPH
ncbi:MAG: S8/S53 family peptidase [Acidobacteriaceae bacterium]|nr:S8/S53 family peptidase [Acidobacteriaceae bacterium]